MDWKITQIIKILESFLLVSGKQQKYHRQKYIIDGRDNKIKKYSINVRNKEEYFVMIQGSVHHGDIIILNRTSEHMKKRMN